MCPDGFGPLESPWVSLRHHPSSLSAKRLMTNGWCSHCLKRSRLRFSVNLCAHMSRTVFLETLIWRWRDLAYRDGKGFGCPCFRTMGVRRVWEVGMGLGCPWGGKGLGRVNFLYWRLLKHGDRFGLPMLPQKGVGFGTGGQAFNEGVSACFLKNGLRMFWQWYTSFQSEAWGWVWAAHASQQRVEKVLGMFQSLQNEACPTTRQECLGKSAKEWRGLDCKCFPTMGWEGREEFGNGPELSILQHGEGWDSSTLSLRALDITQRLQHLCLWIGLSSSLARHRAGSWNALTFWMPKMTLARSDTTELGRAELNVLCRIPHRPQEVEEIQLKRMMLG